MLGGHYVEAVPSKPYIHPLVSWIKDVAAVAGALHPTLHSIFYLLRDILKRAVVLMRFYAVIASIPILSVGLIAASKAISHVGLQSVHAPMRREAVLQCGFGVKLRGNVATQDNRAFAIFCTLDVDKLKHVFLMFQMPQMWG